MATHPARDRPGRPDVRARTARLATLLTVLLTVLTLSWTSASAVPSADPDPDTAAVISLTSTSPQVLRSGVPVTLTGSVTNKGSTTIAAPVLHVGVLGDPLDTREQVSQWSSASDETATPTPVGSVALDQPLEPGQRGTWTLTIPANQLPYRFNLASLPTLLTLTDGPTLTRSATRGAARTYLEWVSGEITQPVHAGWVIPLTLPADPALFGPSGPARTTAWERAIGPDSTIRATLTALAGQPVTWLVDPTMLEPPGAADATVPAKPSPPSPTPTGSSSPSATGSSSPSTSDGSPAPSNSSTPNPTSTSDPTAPSEAEPTPSGTSSTTPPPAASSSDTDPTPSTTDAPGETTPVTVERLAADLRAQLAAVKDDQPVWFLPYGDPDISALRAAAGERAVRSHLDRPLSTDLREIGGTVSWWPAAEVTPGSVTTTLRTWQQTTGGRPLSLLSTRQLSGSQATSTSQVRRQLEGGAPVLAYDESLSAVAARRDGDPGLRTQRFLAETLAIYQQQPQERRSILMLAPRSDRASPAQLAALVSASAAVPWLQPVSTTTLRRESLHRSSAVARSAESSVVPTPSSPISTADQAEVSRARGVVGDISSILVDSADVVTGWDRALGELGSTRWRGRPVAYATTLRTDTEAVGSILDQVTVRPSTVNFFANSGMLSITVVNALDRPINDVQLTVSPRRLLLRVQDQPAPVSLAAGGRTTVRVPVRGYAAGTVSVDAALTTPTGRPLGLTEGKPAQLTVNVRPTGTWIYWVLGMVAGLIFIVGLIRSLRRGPRAETAMPLPDDVPEPTDPDS